MLSGKNQLLSQNNVKKTYPYLLLTIAGLSFCFFIGFPFENHNESFLWIIAFNKVSFTDTLTKQVIGIETFRPLGMANAWLTYRLSGNIYLQQLLNWGFAIASFGVLFLAARNKILFSLLSFITCICFFSGYIYLFHLHGVFYGPFQLYVAVLTYIGFHHRRLSSRLLLITAATTVIICFYHTFALLVYAGLLAAYILQLGKAGKKTDYFRLGILLVLVLALAKIILHTKQLKTVQALTDGLLASYRMAEINEASAVVAMLLTILVALTMVKSVPGRLAAGGATFLLSILFIYWQIPVLVLWVAVCALNMLIAGNLVIAALIATTAILPLGSSSGSPTYIVFVLMICTFVTVLDNRLEIPDFPLLRKLVLAGILLLAVCVLALKAGVTVPVVTAAARPLLAEQEKTQQFRDILAWKLADKQYGAYGLFSYDVWGLPVASKNSIVRTHRPVTEQGDINDYLDFFSKDSSNARKPPLYITLGNELPEGKELVFSVAGKWNGRACVFK